MFYQLSGRAKVRRNRTNEAIALAMQSRWEEAVAVNKSIIEMFPNDTDAYNRLGRALTQLGRYTEASEAYGSALEIEPSNAIARKNLDRLSKLKEADSGSTSGKQVSAHLFLEEAGRSEIADMIQLAPSEVLARVTAADPVRLTARGGNLIIQSMDGEYLGEVEPRLGQRLVKLMNGGNRYTAAIASMADDKGRVMIKEVYQHPSQIGRPSFPARAADNFRPYVKSSVLKYEQEGDEEEFDSDSVDGYEKEESSQHRKSASMDGEISLDAKDEDDVLVLSDDEEEEY